MPLRARTAFLVCNTVAIGASLAVGAGVLRVPPPVGISLAFYALFVVPGIAGGGLLFRSAAAPVEAVCRAFCAGVVFTSVVVCLGFVPGVSYRIISPVAAALAVILAIADRVRPITRCERCVGAIGAEASEGPPARFGSRPLVAALCLFALCFVFLYGSGELGWGTDSLDHVSYIRRSVESGSLFPSDSFYRDGDGAAFDIRKGLWHPVLSLWAYRAHAAPDVLWRLVPSFLSFFALAAFLFFGIELLGSLPYAALGLIFMLLFYGGEGLQWLTKIGFSRNVMQVLFWADSAFFLRYCRLGNTRYLAAVILLSAAACAFHVVYALLAGVFLLAVLLYSVVSRSGAPWRRWLWRGALAQAAGLAIPLVVRARSMVAPLNEIHTHFQGMLVFSHRLAIVDPAEIISRVGLVFFYGLLMIPAYFLVAPRPRRDLVFILTIVPVLLVFNPAFAPLIERRLGYLHYRILDAAPLMFFCALVVGGLARLLARGGPLWSAVGVSRRVGAAIGLAVFLYYPVHFSAHQLATTVENIVKRRGEAPSSVVSFAETLERRIPGHSVIVSDPLTSYVVSAYTDHFVVVTLDQHGSPTDAAALERLRAVRDIMSPAVPLSESFPWFRRWEADYLLLNTNLPEGADFFGTVLTEGIPLTVEKLASCPRALQKTIEENGFILFSVRRDSLGVRPDSCGVRLADRLACRRWECISAATEAGCGILLDTVSIQAGELAPGDTLKGYFCWRVPQAIAFGLPIELTIRIDTDFEKGCWYRDWYGKQYRRIMERRRQMLYRYTWNERLRSGLSFPDRWEAGASVRQDFALVIRRWMAPGRYDLRVKIRRMPYLPNRSVSDYLSNEDSLEGIRVGTITLGGFRASPGSPVAPQPPVRMDR